MPKPFKSWSASVSAVHLGKFTLQLSGFFTVRVGKVLFRIQRFFFFHNVIQAAVAHDDDVHNIVLVVFEMVLLQNAHPVVRAHSHRAGGRLQRAGSVDFPAPFAPMMP